MSMSTSSKAPHHSAASWRSWIRDHENVLKNIRLEVLGGDRPSGEPASPTNEEADRGQTTSEDGGASESGSEVDAASVSLSSSESEGEIRNQDAICLQSPRLAYLPSEKRAAAKYIAETTLATWDGLPRAERWRDFQVEVRP
jgi:hypothetical protein